MEIIQILWIFKSIFIIEKMRRNLENKSFSYFPYTFRFLKWAAFVPNSCALGKCHTLDLNQDVGGLGRFL